MNMEGRLPTPIVFLGADAALARRLESCYAAIVWESEYRLAPRFRACHYRDWRSELPSTGGGLVYMEVANAGEQGESALIREIAAFNPRLQIALLADENVDYFQIAQDFRIGNVIKKHRFDVAIIRSLTIRLLTGNIFGFDPYFPDGFATGPLYRTYCGRVNIQNAIEECVQACSPYIDPEELSTFRIFMHELLTNTFSYAIEGITPEDRDTKLLRPPPEVDIEERRAIKISLVADAEKVGVSVQDSTGNLSMLRVLQKLRRQSKIGGETMPPGIWDETGRGISMVYRYSRFIVNILRGVRTETIFLQYRQKDLNRFESIIITEVIPF
jgi:hypothetical protein